MSQQPAKRRRLDSDDDDDEFAQPRRTSPLLQYAVTAALPTDEVPLTGYADLDTAESDGTAERRVHNGVPHGASSEGSHLAAAVEDGGEGADTRTMGTAGAAVSPGMPVVFDEDDDIPAEYRGLLSTELMNVFLVPFEYICKQKMTTDKLLAQYLPPRSADGGHHGTSDDKTYHNAYGIAPGFRWDGVVRGRGPVE
ncbi:hypothetical protein ABB37_05260 [Leptomonas pyrrhocoris]|uniref:Pre-mRNA-splicing factor of RES complex n=1 Tax=Leptomonas pyrrhocoris TaxID=157538 RepID=A0A0M9G035_LEPPY|nr:hypothetical protein ABB37_05260 [Leptomonas pyrrhocoris]XP_015657855.1 hypothetical protein ABB37_05260 [Leptomonas pyrrhocoris]KPA79415.1 hypothetical protein ABB37_05260 [Leptomonas pyrrhocoris]KPA79416.1 hypothetical protein ABB37_05260 [Leptomonas pyrrhocoris]|eukprot:XP_015657854.1 hypothetical protein ABB37_05260 [Leptomonas pyrrhocoris]